MCIRCLQALVFNKGRPHRSALWTNGSMVAALLAQCVFTLYSIFITSPFNTKVSF